MSSDLRSVIHYERGLWIGEALTPYGFVELVLDGTPDSPKIEHIKAIENFMPNAEDIIQKLRRRLTIPILWRPVRIAPNMQNRVGVQFQHRIFDQRELFFADEI